MTRLSNPGKTAFRARWYRANARDELAEALEAQLAQAGRCKRYGRLLSDPESVELGVGRDCRRKSALS